MKPSKLRSIFNRSLQLQLDPTTLDYISELLQDDQVDQDEKTETIRGIIELELDNQRPSVPFQNSRSSDSIDQCIEEILKLSSEPITSLDESDNETRHPLPPTEPTPPTSHHDQNPKKAILAAYGKVEDEQANPQLKPTAKELKELEESQRNMLDQQLKLLDLKSKTRKKAEAKMGGDPLLRPNLNAALVDHEAKLRREEAATKARAKSEKDKADLSNQRAAQVKKKADARARASKGERKA
ncbi:hypothetical protein CROQUDRAFT_295376 [Cronartium quercuum f. sp. fusiforme G11]|uniref:Uncharacterized protein n=1 Tax=Cronartium quercuum f. sp. fusiforme G11 TaxID=708437 RepID=A0A9P6NCS0_9BASI|nr:hypothetical protein CROQUDRAFT_295376 [Cronartium quercuum f. sp. fusiforme G11]